MNDNTVQKYDRIRGGLEGGALFTKPSTIRNVETITGRAETFVIETGRHAEFGDFVFIECVDENGTTRLCCPPKVADAIASQRDRLAARRRSIAAKAQAKARKDRGERPAFLKRKERG
jgi:hypothetical protein